MSFKILAALKGVDLFGDGCGAFLGRQAELGEFRPNLLLQYRHGCVRGKLTGHITHHDFLQRLGDDAPPAGDGSVRKYRVEGLKHFPPAGIGQATQAGKVVGAADGFGDFPGAGGFALGAAFPRHVHNDIVDKIRHPGRGDAEHALLPVGVPNAGGVPRPGIQLRKTIADE